MSDEVEREFDDTTRSGATPVAEFSLHVEVDEGREGNNGGGAKGKKMKRNESLEERARRMLASSDDAPRPMGPPGQEPSCSHSPQGPYRGNFHRATGPTPELPYGIGHGPFRRAQSSPPASHPVDAFQVSNVIGPAGRMPRAPAPADLWAPAGSLKPMEDEEVYLRRAGMVTNFLISYILTTYVMLTNRRIVIKQQSSVVGLNLYTVEASYLFENVRHVTIQRITNFRFLWGGISLLLVSFACFGMASITWFWVLIGLALLLGGAAAIYWFVIFYNSNSLVIDFSKDDLVGTWAMPAAKGACVSKVLVLNIDHCFDIAYALYNHPDTVFGDCRV